MKKVWMWFLAAALTVVAYPLRAQETKEGDHPICPSVQMKTIETMKKELPAGSNMELLERGVKHVATLWTASDGDCDAFQKFCVENFAKDSEARKLLFERLSRTYEILLGHYNLIDVKLKEPLHLSGDPMQDIDLIVGSYDVSSHFSDDMYATKLAFVTALNFPPYSLAEKSTKGKEWSRLEWAYARMGDLFSARVPAELKMEVSKTLTEADAYISDYNICMDKLRNEAGEQLFPDGMKLITHWGLRDEIKSNYSIADKGLEKQRMIYEVMKHIVKQDIPAVVINNPEVTWQPISNRVFQSGKELSNPAREEDVRYNHLLTAMRQHQKLDQYYPQMPTQLHRAFEGNMELLQADVVKLFEGLLSSPQVKEVAAFISKRLGRPLEPHDIWYNGFKGRGGLPESELDAITKAKYPNAETVWKDLPRILMNLGWDEAKANEIVSQVVVEPSRGAGHAWGATMKGEKAHLRTRITPEGMDYKGYNIAIHEFGHNVEQVLTLEDVDYYMLSGVPNTAFTEAVAFLFQKRDLEMLGLSNPSPEDEHWEALTTFWGTMEIMGVSLVDIAVWEWIYQHPEATPAELREAVLTEAKRVWNTYFADILGGKDEPLLAVYSHMIDNPLYLPNYPIGHLISFQIEEAVKDKNIAKELTRMLTYGRIIPQQWMEHAVGQPISIDPLLRKTSIALEKLAK